MLFHLTVDVTRHNYKDEPMDTEAYLVAGMLTEQVVHSLFDKMSVQIVTVNHSDTHTSTRVAVYGDELVKVERLQSGPITLVDSRLNWYRAYVHSLTVECER